MESVSRPSSLSARLLDRVPVLGQVLQRPLGALGFVIVLVFVVVTIFAPLIAPYDPAKQDFKNLLTPPSRVHILGTDYVGRDTFSRIVYGARVAVEAAFPAVSIALFFGLLLGMLAGYTGGWVDGAILILVDSIHAFPMMILALVMVALLGPSLTNVVIIIAFAMIPGYARVTRAQVLSVKENDFVEAELNLGASTARIIVRHVLPNILGPLVILAAMDLPGVITFEAALSFLGLGVQPPTPSWGSILSDGFRNIFITPWPIVASGLTLMVTTLGFTLFGETLRDVIDPRLSGTKGI